MGALLGGPVADRIGRKWSISAWCMMLHIGLIVQMTAGNNKWYQSKQTCYPVLSQQLTAAVVVGRWIAGLGVGALSLLVGSSHFKYLDSLL
jgi:MFS transporter, SP family, sugar:H+ symporter